MNIAITGVSGFLGNSFISKLIETNYVDNILIFDRNSNIPDDHLYHDDKRIDIIKYDFTNDINYNLSEYANIKDKLDNIDCLIHLAAFVPRSGNIKDDNLEKSIDVNIRGMYNLISIFKNLRYIVFTSTLEVYGISTYLPITENHVTNPISYYGASKLACEKYLSIYGKRNDINVTILRFSTVYGPGDLYNRAIPNFIKSMVNNRNPVIYGNGNDLRDYIYIDDATDAIMCVINKYNKSGEFNGDNKSKDNKKKDGSVNPIYNIASGNVYTIRDIAEKIIEISGKDLKIIYEPRSKPITNFVFNISKAKKYLDFYPSTNIINGLTKEYEWYKHLEDDV